MAGTALTADAAGGTCPPLPDLTITRHTVNHPAHIPVSDHSPGHPAPFHRPPGSLRAHFGRTAPQAHGQGTNVLVQSEGWATVGASLREFRGPRRIPVCSHWPVPPVRPWWDCSSPRSCGSRWRSGGGGRRADACGGGWAARRQEPEEQVRQARADGHAEAQAEFAEWLKDAEPRVLRARSTMRQAERERARAEAELGAVRGELRQPGEENDGGCRGGGSGGMGGTALRRAGGTGYRRADPRRTPRRCCPGPCVADDVRVQS